MPARARAPARRAPRRTARTTVRRPARRRPTGRRRTPAPAPPRARPGRSANGSAPTGPRFSLSYLDRSVDPRTDFYRYAAGGWLKSHPVPADKSRFAGFTELAERNLDLVHEILEGTAADRKAKAGSVERMVGDFYASALDVRRRNALRFRPIEADLARIASIRSVSDLIGALADLHARGFGGLFESAVYPDRKQSSTYALYLWQGGLALPDREYYLKDDFAKIREAYRAHIVAMFRMLGRSAAEAKAAAATVLDLETALARPSRTQTELRDSLKNYNRFSPAELATAHPTVRFAEYLARRGYVPLEYLVVGQPEYLAAVERLLGERSLADWRTYLTWHVVSAAAPHLHEKAEAEHFRFFLRTLLGREKPEPRWKRAAREIDGSIGEALGQLYVRRHFPPEAKARMAEMVDDLRAVFRKRLEGLPWMAPETRQRALEKFDRFTAKIGHPEKFRDYSAVGVDRRDYAGNVRRAAAFEAKRQVDRVGRPVDRTEWHMTPPTVNAYFDATQNEIVFPAGILQPHFFDVAMDDAVNYGAIGSVIGHEITHGYDDQGRQYDAAGNLRDWWTPNDAAEFNLRAKGIIAHYGSFEPLPGAHVNGELTQGENIADFGGVSIAFEALQRRLASDPTRRKVIDGFTPEQRFFLSYSQIWRENSREPDQRMRLTVDPHAPGRYRANAPLMHFGPFYDAFGIRPGDGMWRAPSERVTIW